jgi:hypothetical protein
MSQFSGCTNVTSVSLPNSLTSIGYHAFDGCTSLTNINIPRGVYNIYDNPWEGCTSLTAIPVDPLNKTFASIDGVLIDEVQDDYRCMLVAFPSGKGGEYVVPSYIKSIGFTAFSTCTNLTSVTFPGSVDEFKGVPFYNCTALKSVYFEGNKPGGNPASLFMKSTNVTVYYQAGTTGWDTTYGGQPTALWVKQTAPGDYEYITNDTSVTITRYVGPGGEIAIPAAIQGLPVTCIGYGAFSGCSNLTGVTIPDTVTCIERLALGGCYGLKNATIGNSVTNLGVKAFFRCGSLTQIAIPGNVASIGWGAFKDCTNLANIQIPNSVSSIGDYTFFGCGNLLSVTIPNGVTYIGENAFRNCASLKTISMPNSVTNIGNAAFTGCRNLKNITIPLNVTRIEDLVFSSCGIRNVYFQGDVPSAVGKYSFIQSIPTIYYLPGTKGWGSTFGGRPTKLWEPLAQTGDADFGVRTNQFGFNINWASGQTVVVDACTNLTNPTWFPLQTNTLIGGTSYFSEPQWTNYSVRFYRLRRP